MSPTASLVAALAAALFLGTCTPRAAGAAHAPNVLIILSDDQGWGDLEYNCENSTGMCAHTPHLHRLATAPGSAYFHRFYAAAGVCSPTRASILTGRTNERSCINNALPCDNEDPAPGCSMGKGGSLPTTEFTVADAAKRSPLGDYATIQLGKWHLGDLWDKKLPDMNPKWPVSNPGNHGFDEWLTTEAEASSSMSNCGCFPVNHSHPGPKPPSGYNDITPHGDKCVVGGGFFSDWCYPCTDYYSPDKSSPTSVRALADTGFRVPGDDSMFLVSKLERFLDDRVQDGRPWLAHLCLHSIHEPHPAMPEYYDMYARDPDYLGTLTQLDAAVGAALDALDVRGMRNDTVIFYTTDNGPHQGKERSNIRWSTGYSLRQCKASVFEGGLRVPGIMHWPQGGPSAPINVTTPVGAVDVFPTVMELLGVNKSANPTWIVDGVSMLPVMRAADHGAPRSRPLVFSWGNQQGIIDNEWKLITKPAVGQCDQQPGFDFKGAGKDELFLYNLADDIHESRDLKLVAAHQYARMRGLLTDFRASLNYSRHEETGCPQLQPRV